MKKIFLILLTVYFGFSTNINAQVQQVEWEILYGGVVIPTKDVGSLGITLGTEVRFNLYDGKISTGMEFSLSGFYREYNVFNDYYGNIEYTNVGTHFLSFQGLCDYNFKPRNKIVPFAGFGLGFVASTYDDNPDGFFISPSIRVGCEFYKFLRTTLDFRLMKYGFNYFSLRLGFVIGGRNKKV
ncbi:MAG: hypothetical protein LBQ28_07250 [Prevotellaceae bacterium]|jgi:hypothetical protein|nr:hypothetical protein [Prevotellaceae bacterium]